MTDEPTALTERRYNAMSLLRSWFLFGLGFYKDAAPLALGGQSGGGPPHSRTLTRGTGRPANAERPGVRQSSGAVLVLGRRNLETLPAGDGKARAGGRRSAPSKQNGIDRKQKIETMKQNLNMKFVKITFLIASLVLLASGLYAQPVITSPATNLVVLGGSNAVFHVEVSGTGPFTYQWQLNGTNLPNINIITAVAGGGTNSPGDGGLATNANLGHNLQGLTLDKNGNLFFPDGSSSRIRKVDTNGIITTVVGNGANGYSGDGGLATNAQIYQPGGVAVDSSGNMFIADTCNGVIRKVDTSGIITTMAGKYTNMPYSGGKPNYSGDGGAATNAGLSWPWDVVLDSAGNLLIADYGNYRIRKVGTDGIITTVVGNGTNGFYGDGGPAANANISSVPALCLDASGNLLIMDQVNNQRLRKVGTNGIIITVAGNGGNGSYSGDGGPATNASLCYPWGVCEDTSGNMFIGDLLNSRIRMVGTNGIITTVAGTGVLGNSGDGGPAINAKLGYIVGTAIDAAGNLYFGDQIYGRIRKVAMGGSPILTLTNVSLTNAGTYTVIVTSPSGSVTGTVANVTVLLTPQAFTAQATGGGLQLQFTGTPGYPYILQSATNLTPPINWQSILTNYTDSNGNWSFIVTNLYAATNVFYRAAGQ